MLTYRQLCSTIKQYFTQYCVPATRCARNEQTYLLQKKTFDIISLLHYYWFASTFASIFASTFAM